MTIIIDNLKEEGRHLKEIEFKKYIDTNFSDKASNRPKDFVEVIRIGKYKGYDIVIGIAEDGQEFMYLGHWNDGVIDE